MNTNIRDLFKSNLLLIAIGAIYILSRIYLYVFVQLEFSYHLRDYLIQYLDVSLLKENLFESILYLHSQPPLFNFAIGFVEILFGEYSYIVFLLIFQLMGLLIAVLGYKTLLLTGTHKNLAFISILFYILTPATILYENLFFYTHPIIFFLVLSGYNLLVYLEKERFKNLIYVFTGITLSVFTTSFFHIIWFITILIIILLFKKVQTKTIIKAAILPFVLILGLYLKNYLLFDEFETSTWLGMNISRITVHQLDKELKSNLITNKKLSEISNFASFTHYNDLYSLKEKYFNDKTGISVLDQTVKKSGRTNFNNSGYIKISRLALSDAIYVIKNYPQVYFSGIVKAFTLYFDSPTKYKLLTANVFRIKTYNKLYNAFIYGSSLGTKTGDISIVLNLLVLFISGFLLINRRLNIMVRGFIAFALLNIFYVMCVGNLLELGENNRFRYYTEIFNFILLVIIINELIIKKFTNKTQLI